MKTDISCNQKPKRLRRKLVSRQTTWPPTFAQAALKQTEKTKKRSRKTPIGTLCVLLALLFAVPLTVHAGGMDIFMTVIKTAASLGHEASVLQGQNASQQNYNSQVIAPSSNLNQVSSFLNSAQRGYNSWMSQVHGLPLGSSSLSQTSSLENSMFGNSSSIHSQYTTVYGGQPASSSITPALAKQSDMSDAAAKEALVLAAQSDTFSSTLINSANTLQQQAANTAPGTATMVEAQSLAMQLHSQAVQHRLLASLLRQKATQLATETGALKQAASTHTNVNQSTQQLKLGGQ